jgi:hypothetical protein
MQASATRDSTQSPLHDWRAGSPTFRMACIGIVLIAVAIRVFHLGQPMRLDEARTFLDYVIRPLPDAISNYNIPNNHLFHTLLAWMSTRLFGDAEWAVRLPAFLAGVLSVGVTYAVARALADEGAALIASALAAVLPGLVLYATNARGYSMVTLAFVTLIVLANRIASEETAARWLAFGAVVVLGFATVPAMLYPAGAVSLWLFVERARRHGPSSALRFAPRLAGVLAGAVALAALAYLPAIERFGLEAITGNKFVTPYPWPLFVDSLPRFAQRLRDTLGLGIPNLLLLMLAAGALLPLVIRSPGQGRLGTLAATTAVWCIVLLVMTRRAPPPRVWLFLAPLLCVYAGIGLATAASWLARRVRIGAPTAHAAVALTLAVGIGASTIARRTIFDNDESVGLVAGPAIAAWLLAEVRPDDRLVVSNFVSPEVDYYLHTRGGRRFGDLEAPSRSARALLILNERQSQTPATVRSERPDLDWSRFETPVMLRQFEHASVWAASRRTP